MNSSRKREPRIKCIGNIYDDSYGGSFAGSVYDITGISPAILHHHGGNKMPLILVEYDI